MKIFSTIFLAFILISSFSAPQTAHAGFIADAVSSVVGTVGDVISGAVDIVGNVTDNITSITSGVIQGSLNLVTGGSFSDGYKQGFCNLGGGGYDILNGGGCDSGSTTTVAEVFGACDNSGTNNCNSGTASSMGGNWTSGYTWNCDGIPNDEAHRATGCLFSAVPIVVTPVVEVFGVCDNTGGYNCAVGSLGSHSGDATNGWTWSCDGTPNDAAHRATGCFFKPTSTTVTPTCTTVWTSNSKACNLYPGYTNYTGNVSFEYDSCNLANIRNIDTSGCVAPVLVSSVTWTNYCTGTDAGATPPHPWQIWAYSNETPAGWKFVENGTVANGCVPSVTSCTPSADQTETGQACISIGYSSGTYSRTRTSSCPGPTYGNWTNDASSCWINYCTGGNDVNGNYWQIWAHTPDYSQYKFVTSGTVANNCAPGVVPPTVYGCMDQTATNYNSLATSQTGAPCTYGTGPGGGTPGGGGTPSGGSLPSGCGVGTLNNTCCVPGAGTYPCWSPANNCGLRYPGTYTISCSGSVSACSEVTPPANIPVTATIKAIPNRVKPSGQTTLSLTATGINTCSVTKNGKPFSWSPLVTSPVTDPVTCSLGNSSHNSFTDIVTDQSTYVISCQDQVGGKVTTTQIVNVDPNFNEF